MPTDTSAQAERDQIEGLLVKYLEAKNGWSRLRPRLFDLSPRWQWWALALLTKRLPPAATLPYPKIVFADHLTAESPPIKMIRACLAPFRTDERAFEDFLDWLLFAFGDPQTTVLAPAKAARFRHFEETFAVADLLEHPGDWIGHIYETEIASKGTKDASGFFTTPPTICKAMTEMGMHDAPLLATVNEPCCGTGRMLMEASNFCVHLSGQDINLTLVKIAKVNGWLYMPSLVMPFPELGTAGSLTVKANLTIKTSPDVPSAPAALPPLAAPHPIEPATSTTKERTPTWTTPTLFPES